MLKIGDFSRLGKITLKTLRYYDEIGLLSPDHVNTQNGYRYYSPDKLGVVGQIQELKNAGLFLDDIRRVLGGDFSTGQLLELYSQRRDDLEEEITSKKNTLRKLDLMIEMVQKQRAAETAVLKSLPEVIVASMRTTIPDYNALFKVVPPMGVIMQKQGAVCREPAYCFMIFHDGEYRENNIDIEICEAVTDYCTDGDGITYKKTSAVPKAASILHHGPYHTLSKSYAAVYNWMDKNGYLPVDNPRESYIDGIWNREDPQDWLTEIQVPVKSSF